MLCERIIGEIDDSGQEETARQWETAEDGFGFTFKVTVWSEAYILYY